MLILIIRTECIHVELQRLHFLTFACCWHITEPRLASRHLYIVVLACVEVEEFEVIKCEYHRAEWGIVCIPFLVRDVVMILQVVAYTHSAYSYRGIVGHKQYLPALCEKFCHLANYGWVSKGSVM